jgi:maltose O-acetyltransferase
VSRPADRLVRWWSLRRCDAVGDDARVVGVPFVDNLGRIELGAGVIVRSIPVRSHLVTGPRGVLRIGRDVDIAHGASISAHAEVDIGEGAVLGPFVMILDADFHDARDRLAAGAARPIRIGRGVRLGAGVVVLRGATIGDGATVAPNSVVSRHIPPGARAAGVPARPS